MIKLIVLMFLITGCATNQSNFQTGNRMYYKGNMAGASKFFYRCAQAGETACMYNLAIVHLETGYDKSAISWLTRAARYNHPDSISKLTALNQPIPQVVQRAAYQPEEDITLFGAVNSALEGYNRGNSKRINCTSMDLGGIISTTCR